MSAPTPTQAPPEPGAQARCQRLCTVLAFTALAIGAMGFAGWVFDIEALKRCHSAFVAMKFNAAVGLILAAAALLLLRRESVQGWQYRTARLMAAISVVIGVVTLLEHVLGRDAGIDQFFFRESQAEAGQSFPGRMWIESCVGLILIGIALLVLDKSWSGKYCSGFLALVAATFVSLVALYYFYGVEQFDPIAKFATIAPHTVVAFVCLSAAVMLSRPDRGMTATLCGNDFGSAVARRMLLPAILVPIVFGWLCVLGHRAGLYGAGFGMALFTLSLVVVFTGLIWWTAKWLNRAQEAQRASERALRYSEEKFAVLFQKAPYPVVVTTYEDPAFLDVNEAFVRMFGFSKEEVLGKTGVEIGINPDPDLRASLLVELDANGNIRDREAPLRDRNGRDYVVVINADAVKIAGEKYLLITGHDITERKRAREALRRSEEKFSVLFHKAPFAVALSRFSDSVFVDVNDEFLRMFGYAKEEVLGKTDVDINMIPDPELRMAVLMELQSGGGVLRQREIRMRSRHGRDYIALINADIVQIAGEMHLLATCEDITERKQGEEALQRAKAQLQEHAANLEHTVAERTAELKETNEQLEAFVYSIAHDLRAPLRSMQGYSHILLEDLGGKLPEAEQKFLHKIHASAGYMDRMILDLLAFGRTARTQITLNTVDVQKIWDAACFQCTEQIEQTDARIETVKPLPTVRADSATLTQVFANLLNNAMKFVNAGVRPEIRFWAEDLGHSVRLWLQDNGVGIDAKYHERIFWVFERLDAKNFAGTGIGLSIVRKGVDRMNGHVGLESEVGKGTRFWIELPKA